MARRKHAGGHEEFHVDERWLITYADMITLLLAVFIVLYALSDTNVRKFNEFAQSVSAAFNTDIFRGTQAITLTSGQKTAPDTDSFDAGSGVLSSDQRTIEATLKNYAVEHAVEGQVTVERVPEGIAIRISDALLFASGRASLNPSSPGLLDQVLAVIAPLPNMIRVEGHTDTETPNGPFYTDNWRLSVDRATAVLEAMIATRIDPSRLSAAGYGQYRPVAPNTDDAGRASNRRVDVLVLYPKDPAADTSAAPSATSIGSIP